MAERLEHQGAVCEYYLYGATVTKFTTASGRDLIWVSSTAKLDGTKAIRGGIPLVFPQFGQPIAAMAQHGFARNNTWKVAKAAEVNADGQMEVTLSLDQSMATHEAWAFPYELQFIIKLAAEKLTTEYVVVNTGDSPFGFQSLQHTYLEVGNIAETVIQGFRGGRFMDKTSANPAARNVETRQDITLDQFTDRVYTNFQEVSEAFVKTPTGTILVKGSGVLKEAGAADALTFPSDIVMWNPWAEKAAGMADFDDEGYKRMLCIEPGFVSDFHNLNPQSSFTLTQELFALVDAPAPAADNGYGCGACI